MILSEHFSSLQTFTKQVTKMLSTVNNLSQEQPLDLTVKKSDTSNVLKVEKAKIAQYLEPVSPQFDFLQFYTTYLFIVNRQYQ